MRKFFHVVFTLNFLYILLIAAQVAAIVFLCLLLPSFLPGVIAFAAVWALNVITAVLLLSQQGAGAEARCAWLMLTVALPVAGAVLCLLCMFKKQNRGILTVTNASDAPLSSAAHALCGTCSAGYDKAVYFAKIGRAHV